MDNLKMTLDKLLSQWGLDREVVNKFLHNKIQINQLNKLTPKDIKKLIPKIGDRIKFQTAMQNNYSEFQRKAIIAQSHQLSDSQFCSCKRKRVVDQLVEKKSEDDKLRLLKKPNMQLAPTDDELKNCIIGILDKVNLDTTSMKTMFSLVFAEYPLLDLSFKKDFIRDTINSLLSRSVNSVQAVTTAQDQLRGSHVEWKSNDVGCCANKKSKKSLYKTAGNSSRQSNKNNPKKKQFVRRILKSDPILRSLLLEKVKHSIESCISSVLYAENIQLIDTTKLNVKEGGFYCPLCSRFMTPQYKWNSNKDSIIWDVSNFRRHLLLFHSDQPSTSDSDDGSTSDSSEDTVYANRYTAKLIQIDAENWKRGTSTSCVNSATNNSAQDLNENANIFNDLDTSDSVIILSDNDECDCDENQEIESPVVGVDTIKSIKTEPTDLVPLINFMGQGHSEPPITVNGISATDNSLQVVNENANILNAVHSIDSVIILSDDDECDENQEIESPVVGVDTIKSIKTDAADLAPLINFMDQGHSQHPISVNGISATNNSLHVVNENANILNAVHSIDSVIILSDDDECDENQEIESPVVGVDTIKSIKTDAADLAPLINFMDQGHSQPPILVNGTVYPNNSTTELIHDDGQYRKSETFTLCVASVTNNSLQSVNENSKNAVENQKIDLQMVDVPISSIKTQTTDLASIAQGNEIQTKETNWKPIAPLQLTTRSGRVVKPINRMNK